MNPAPLIWGTCSLDVLHPFWFVHSFTCLFRGFSWAPERGTWRKHPIYSRVFQGFSLHNVWLWFSTWVVPFSHLHAFVNLGQDHQGLKVISGLFLISEDSFILYCVSQHHANQSTTILFPCFSASVCYQIVTLRVCSTPVFSHSFIPRFFFLSYWIPRYSWIFHAIPSFRLSVLSLWILYLSGGA